MFSEDRIDQLAAIILITGLVVGCFVVLSPFFSAILWAVILSYSTWGFYYRIERAVGGRKSLAAGLMVLVVATVLILPLAFLGISLTDNVTAMLDMARQLLSKGPPPPPSWVAKLPLLGSTMHDQWHAMAGSGTRLTEALIKYLMPLQDWALRSAANLGVGVLYLSLSVLISFFFYRDGTALSERLEPLFVRVGGERAPRLLLIAEDTIKSVVYGILGTALAQGFVAGIGFMIARVPGALLLGVLTCFLSMIPLGPPLIWIPAAIWLFQKGEMGWAIFLALWGLLVVSSIDNVLKPYLIGKGSHLPFILVSLGVLGGVMSFGLLGIFLGPTLLAIAYALFQEWSFQRMQSKNEFF